MNGKSYHICMIILAAAVSLVGCGGGGGGGTSTTAPGTPASKILSWAPPTAYEDNTTLNPSTDLDVFEVYIRQDGNFTSNDNAMAALQAVDPGTAQLTTSFDLNGLSPFLSNGVTYYVSVRAVAKNGLKSDFSRSATFSL